MNITAAIDTENKRVAKEVDLIYTNHSPESKEVNENETKLKFFNINKKIRQLNSELRRILKTEDDQPTYIETNVCNYFDGLKAELIPFKVA